MVVVLRGGSSWRLSLGVEGSLSGWFRNLNLGLYFGVENGQTTGFRCWKFGRGERKIDEVREGRGAEGIGSGDGGRFMTNSRPISFFQLLSDRSYG